MTATTLTMLRACIYFSSPPPTSRSIIRLLDDHNLIFLARIHVLVLEFFVSILVYFLLLISR